MTERPEERTESRKVIGTRANTEPPYMTPERPEERDSLSAFTEHLSSTDDEINAGYHHYVIRTLINEVKDAHKALDEANDTMFADLGRISQMGEALRDRCYGDTPACYTEASGYHGCVCWTGPRAALSPPDTEEPR